MEQLPETTEASLSLEELAGQAEALSSRLEEAGPSPALPLRREAWELLDLLRRPAVLGRIDVGERDAWASRILDLVERSHLTVGPLFRMRVQAYGSRPLFQVPTPTGSRPHSWRQVGARVETLARGLLSLLDGGEEKEGAHVAILSENRIETAWVDLACLTSGLVNVPIPANSTEADVGYILGHSRARIVIVSGAAQLKKVLQNRDSLPHLERVVTMGGRPARNGEVLTLNGVAARAGKISPSQVEKRGLAVRIGDLATIMYTSGTTGTPKAIQFSQRNIVFKRFARAMALPEIGEKDVFLCYLPLYHTFGRFLEMMGCIFWGSTYCFLLSSSVEALVKGMRHHRPTVFISVPKKWIQLYDAIARQADPDSASDEELLEATRRVTGGRLRWGLSAAGHLDSEIFRFFQRNGTELMSGFGMTEATGGISMTPPGGYRDDSLGFPLPGIETRLEADGELLVRGPYVMMGYLDPPGGEPSFDEEGWFRTGDLMDVDPDGRLRLVDRSKEIYKNIKGETIAPQRVENLFRDLESVGRVFLVGDHREFNTALIYPNPQCKQPDFGKLDGEETKNHFRSLVVSVNKFLSPFERIVDFAIIDRDLDPGREELTAKGTPRRKIVERNFAEVIRLLYRRTNLNVGGLELTFPNWLFQSLGITAQEIQVGRDRILLRTSGASLSVKSLSTGTARIGSCVYRHPPGPVNLGALLTTPRLWLGNEELVDFVALDLPSRERPRAGEGLVWKGRVKGRRTGRKETRALNQALRRDEHDLLDLHTAALSVQSSDEKLAFRAVRLLERILGEEESTLQGPARGVLARARVSSSVKVRRQAFLVLAGAETDSRFAARLETFLSTSGLLLDGKTRAALCQRDLSETKLEAFVRVAGEVSRSESWNRETERRATSLLRFLAEYGAVHPTSYRRLRAFLVRMMLFSERERVRREASRAASSLQEGFRRWLGPGQEMAVDPETGLEYRWADVVSFDKDVSEPDRERLLDAMRKTSFLREAVFLFSKGSTVRLSDIPPGGIWIRHLGSRHGKSVYRMTVQTRYQGGHDVAINVNQELSQEQVREEILLLILCGESADRDPLVEEFGGYWEEQDLWSEEFIPGETLDRILLRRSRRADDQERFRQIWSFFAWSALSAYVDFWSRTGRRWEIAEPATASVIVPTHDFLTGGRLLSVSARRRFTGLASMIETFRSLLLAPVEETHPALRGCAGWDLIFASVLEVVGETEGLKMFRRLLKAEDGAGGNGMRAALERYIEQVEVRGFLPMRLFFAAQRYRRWAALSSEPTTQARASTMQELYDDYGLQRLGQAYPETRVRFFRDTVFHRASEPLAEGLEEMIGKMRRGELVGDELIEAVADLRARLSLDADEDYFLARLSFPHLRPEDDAGFVQTDQGGRHKSEMVVTLEDREGNPFLVRHALNPKEVDRLHSLFLGARLDVRFRPEHQYLVALNHRFRIIGGIYYDVEEEGRSAHLEKIVVAEPYRKKGVGNGLMSEFFHRLRAGGVRTVTTGFYRPEYFYSFGFAIEKRYAGLVKTLEEADARGGA